MIFRFNRAAFRERLPSGCRVEMASKASWTQVEQVEGPLPDRAKVFIHNRDATTS